MFTPPTTTLLILPNTLSTEPSLPESLPNITFTLSPFFSFCISSPLPYFSGQRYYFAKTGISNFSGNRPENTGGAQVVIFINNHSGIFIKLHVRTIITSLLFSAPDYDYSYYLTVFNLTVGVCTLNNANNNFAGLG